MYQNGEFVPNDHKWPKNITKGHAVYQIAIKIPSFCIPRPAKLNTDWCFWYENIVTIWQPWCGIEIVITTNSCQWTYATVHKVLNKNVHTT
jgi:hypothetical protein